MKLLLKFLGFLGGYIEFYDCDMLIDEYLVIGIWLLMVEGNFVERWLIRVLCFIWVFLLVRYV